MQAKARNDLGLRQRLLDFIGHVSSECMPKELIDATTPDLSHRVFQSFPDPQDIGFDSIMDLDVSSIVHGRQMHSENHNPTCFKYSRKKRKCRSGFPKPEVDCTCYDEETSTFHIKRDHPWLNGFNRWLSLVMRANHDYQVLFTKAHSLTIIHYIMKYITKPEAALHAKLTISAAIMDIIHKENKNIADVGKSMLLKTYNKLDSHREVGIPEALTYLLKLPDHFTNQLFETIHTTQLLHYMQDASVILSPTETPTDQPTPADQELPSVPVDDPLVDSAEIIVVNKNATIVSKLDDYAFRHHSLHNYCLYDFVSMVYKKRQADGLLFTPQHPQHSTTKHHIRQVPSVPTLLGKLLFVKPDPDDKVKREDYYCMLTGLFIPWSSAPPTKTVDGIWEDLYNSLSHQIVPHIRRIIDNLELLRKSKEDAIIDRLQRAAHESAGDIVSDISDDDDYQDHLDAINDDNDTLEIPYFETLEEDHDIQRHLEWYIHEIMHTYEKTLNPITSPSHDPDDIVHYTDVPADELLSQAKQLSKSFANSQRRSSPTRINGETATPSVYLTYNDHIVAMKKIVEEFQLNEEQTRAFSVVANHSIGESKVGPQLLMGVYGEGGTGKSRVIDAIQSWFELINIREQLVITATTGAAAHNINGSTLHSAVSIGYTPDGDASTTSVRQISANKIKEWEHRKYIIIDEVSMLDAGLLARVHTQLTRIKSRPEETFGGLNILFFGDFLQMPSVKGGDVYSDSPATRQGFRLWRSQNVTIKLTQQMRQAGDPQYAQLLDRVRRRCPTDEDINVLYSRIGAILPDHDSLPIVVRRHALRHSINHQMLHHLSEKNNTPITYCIANVIKRSKMHMKEVYGIKGGTNTTLGDSVLGVLPGSPLLITKNIDQAMGTMTEPFLANNLGLINGAIVKFYGFADNDDESRCLTSLPEYMLVELPNKNFQLDGLPPGVFPLTPVQYTSNLRNGRSTTLKQFPVTLAYAITDYKCQGQTYSKGMIADLHKSSGYNPPAASLYVQLSRVTTLSLLSILRLFDPDELRQPLSEDLLAELAWQDRMAERTRLLYSEE